MKKPMAKLLILLPPPPLSPCLFVKLCHVMLWMTVTKVRIINNTNNMEMQNVTVHGEIGVQLPCTESSADR